MSDQKRRDFLKIATAGLLAPVILPEFTPGATDYRAAQSTKRAALKAPVATEIPTVDSMRSVTMPHRFGDLFNPPGLTNQWGCVQAAMDVTGVRSIAFPPFAQGEMNTAALGSGGELLTGVLYVDGEYSPAPNEMIEYVWQPDRVERRARYRGLELSSLTIVPFKQMSVAVSLTVANMQKGRRKTEIKLALNGAVTRSVAPWNAAYSPGEFDNPRSVDRDRGAIMCKSVRTDAYSLQGAWPRADDVLPSWLVYRFDLAPGEQRTITFVNALAGSAAEAQRHYDALVRNFEAAATQVRDEWNAELKAVFTPGNDRFSGYLPTLVTNDESVRRLYHSAVMSALFFKRPTPHSVYGTAYVTLAPRYWETTTFLWDISLSSL